MLAPRVLKCLLFGYNDQSTQSTGLSRLVVIWSSLCMELRKHCLVFTSVSLLGGKQGFDDRLDLFYFVEAKKYACNSAFAV